MNAKNYVLQYFPDAEIETDGQYPYIGYEIWSEKALSFIGSGTTEDRAWEDAKQWIDSQPDLMNNFKPE